VDTANIELPFGHGVVSVSLAAADLLGVFEPEQPASEVDERALTDQALSAPIGAPPLRDLARPGQSVAVVISDLTRPCPSDRLLPAILDELATAGVRDHDVTVVAALGTHRPMTPDELKEAAGELAYERVRVINHDPGDTVRLGTTSAGTPVELFRPVVEADLRVCLGNLEFHYFAGYSGGAKAILPGCASRATVQANHAMMVRPEAVAARLDDNPIRADIEAGVYLLGVDFILNVLVDGQKRIVGAVAGDVTAAHRVGCDLVARQHAVRIPQLADIVLVSAGGYPKDVNLYQAQKAIDNAKYAARDGGIIILVAECREGLGHHTFEAWMREACSPDDLLERIQREFVIGGHKAAAIAGLLKRCRVFMVSSLPDEAVRACWFTPFDSVDAAIDAALSEMGPSASLVALPQGASVLPIVGDRC
jgi:nickel-dependent lactate racemase